MGLRHYISIAAIALSPVAAPASTIVLSDILSVDALGYECVGGEYFDETDDQAAIAFTISEKIRLPRTCLPNPCDRALTRRELSNLTGTEVSLARFDEEWDEYYARYADHCRKEIVDPSEEEIADEDFWEPFRPENGPTIVATGPNPDPIYPGPNPVPVPPTNPLPPLIVSPNPPETPTDPSDPTDPTDPTVPEISPVPLPSSLLFMLSGLLLFFRRKNS